MLRNRLLPAILTATGVSLIAGGLLTYTGAAEMSPAPPSPTSISLGPTPTIALPTFPPPGSSAPSTSPTPAVERVATRIRIPALDIDLPVVKQPGGADTYPLCNVAMYIQQLHQPGQGAATYLYAHARPGMFGPIYNLAIVKHKPDAMVGMYVEVFTSDDMRFTYIVKEVLLHQTELDRAARRDERGALAPDLRGAEGNEGQDAGSRDPAHDRAGLSRGGQPEAQAGRLRLIARLSGRACRP